MKAAACIVFALTLSVRADRPDGIDVSHWQGDIAASQWTQIYNGGYVFCFTKATQGNYYTDNTLVTNMQRGQDAGLLMGCYHFADPESVSATAEANYFVSVAGGYMTAGYLRPVLDLEWGTSLGSTALSNWVNTFLNTVEAQTGVEPLIYTNTNFATNYLNSTVANRDLWVAAYWYTPNPEYGEPSIGVFNDWAFWQWTSSGSVPGMPGSIDCDVFNGTMVELQAFVIGGGIEAPTITQHPENQVVFTDQPASFSVQATGDEPLEYHWQKNGVNLIEGSRYTGVTTPVLSIPKAISSDMASYRCRVSNDGGEVYSNAATLTVRDQPGDFDLDDDVDLDDFGHFQTCLTGSAVAVADPACYAANLDGDNDVDSNDVAIFQACMSGTNIPADIHCAD